MFFGIGKKEVADNKQPDTGTKPEEKTTNQLGNIIRKPFRKGYKIGDMMLDIEIDGAAYAAVDGKEELLDEPVIQRQIEEITDMAKHWRGTKYQPLPKFVTIRTGQNADAVYAATERAKKEMADKTAADSTADKNPPAKGEEKKNAKEVAALDDKEIIVSGEARWDFSQVHLPKATKDEIEAALLLMTQRETLFDKWKLAGGAKGRALVFNFYGPPGTGKSMTGEAIAAQLKKKVYNINYAQLESKYVGDTPKNIRAVFKRAAADGAVLVFDEADSFLGKRLTNVSQSADYGVNIARSVMLLELEKYDGIVIFTTNMLSNYDEAFKRRIFASIEFRIPDEAAREEIWKLYLTKELPKMGDITPKILAARYDGQSGADIKDAVLYAALHALKRNKDLPQVTLADFDYATEMIKGRYSGGQAMQNVKVTHERISAEQFAKEASRENAADGSAEENEENSEAV